MLRRYHLDGLPDQLARRGVLAEGFPAAMERAVLTAWVEDRGGSSDNPLEAARVAQRVIHHFDTRPEHTLGVVALSKAQAETIEEAVQKARAARPDLDHLCVVEVEGPVEKEVIYTRVRLAWGIGRAGQVVRDRIDRALRRLLKQGKIVHVGTAYDMPGHETEYSQVSRHMGRCRAPCLQEARQRADQMSRKISICAPTELSRSARSS
ncbi:DUF3320 domain-containing protein [Streptomyces sp. NPDC001020]